MKKFKIVYVLNSDTKVTYVEAKDMNEALTYFYLTVPGDDISSIEVASV